MAFCLACFLLLFGQCVFSLEGGPNGWIGACPQDVSCLSLASTSASQQQVSDRRAMMMTTARCQPVHRSCCTALSCAVPSSSRYSSTLHSQCSRTTHRKRVAGCSFIAPCPSSCRCCSSPSPAVGCPPFEVVFFSITQCRILTRSVTARANPCRPRPVATKGFRTGAVRPAREHLRRRRRSVSRRPFRTPSASSTSGILKLWKMIRRKARRPRRAPKRTVSVTPRRNRRTRSTNVVTRIRRRRRISPIPQCKPILLLIQSSKWKNLSLR